MQAAGEWLAALAVVRAERSDRRAFHEIYTAVFRRLEPLSEQDRMRWRDLVWFVLSWALRRRPGAEREELLEAARSSQMDIKHREEVAELSESLAETWEQELMARGRAEGEARGRAEGEARGRLEALRENVRVLLEERFGPLPQPLAAEIATIGDAERLPRALRQVVHIDTLEQLVL